MAEKFYKKGANRADRRAKAKTVAARVERRTDKELQKIIDQELAREDARIDASRKSIAAAEQARDERTPKLSLWKKVLLGVTTVGIMSGVFHSDKAPSSFTPDFSDNDVKIEKVAPEMATFIDGLDTPEMDNSGDTAAAKKATIGGAGEGIAKHNKAKENLKNSYLDAADKILSDNDNPETRAKELIQLVDKLDDELIKISKSKNPVLTTADELEVLGTIRAKANQDNDIQKYVYFNTFENIGEDIVYGGGTEFEKSIALEDLYLDMYNGVDNGKFSEKDVNQIRDVLKSKMEGLNVAMKNHETPAKTKLATVSEPTFEVENIPAQSAPVADEPVFEVSAPAVDDTPTFEVQTGDSVTPVFEVQTPDNDIPTFEVQSQADEPVFDVSKLSRIDTCFQKHSVKTQHDRHK